MMTTKETVIKRLIDLRLVSNKNDAHRWLVKESISSLEGKTAAELIIGGHTEAVLEYIERMAEGGFA